MRLFLIFLLIMLAACGDNGANGDAKRDQDALIRLTDNDARGLDPQMVSDLSSIRILSDLFEGLTRFDAKGQAEPGLAYTWETSTDGMIWTFRLRDNLVFSDGTPILAALFIRALDRIRDEKAGSPHGSLYAVIDHISAPDSKTVIIRLQNPFPQLPALLAHPAMAALPFHRINKAGEKWTADRPLVTSGAYRLKDWKLAQQIELEANPRWNGGAPVTRRVIWRPMENLNSAMRAVLAGNADIGTDYPTSRHHWLRLKYPALARNFGYLGTYYYAFNTRKPPFNDKRVRKALSMAVDRNWLAQKMVDAGNAPAWGILPAALRDGEAYKPDWADWPQTERLQVAKSLLARAGYGPKNPLRFEISFNSSSEHRKAAVAMATMWRALGVEASLLNSEASLHFDRLKRADFALGRSGWIADLPAPENFLNVHRANAGVQNYSGYNNPRYEAAMDAALSEPEPQKRLESMRSAEEILIDDAPILPLYFYTSRALVSRAVTGWQDNAGNVHPSRTLGLQR
jgi:oligopeptide transport system substrate-binding protein